MPYIIMKAKINAKSTVRFFAMPGMSSVFSSE